MPAVNPSDAAGAAMGSMPQGQQKRTPPKGIRAEERHLDGLVELNYLVLGEEVVSKLGRRFVRAHFRHYIRGEGGFWHDRGSTWGTTRSAVALPFSLTISFGLTRYMTLTPSASACRGQESLCPGVFPG